jgi:predicted RNA-binding protein with RPS1 domain
MPRSKNLRENLSVKKRDKKDKIYCHEPYAQELYDLLCGIEPPIKDVENGQVLKATDLRFGKKSEIEIITDAGIGLFLDMRKEKKYFEALGFNDGDFDRMEELSSSGWFREIFKERNEFIAVEDKEIYRGSMFEAYLNKTKSEFVQQISQQNAYYVAKIMDKNQGGFFIKVQGVDAFLPGSLAAANKIVDFEDYIGREVNVMVEDYLKQSDTFIFSYKRYLEKILPSRLSEIERFSRMKGFVTGTSKYGVFVEFEEIFTGLLHTSEMDELTLERFKTRTISPGEEFEVWVKDIKDNKLILTEIDPAEKQEEIENFKSKIEGRVKSMKVVSIKPFGAFFEVEENRIGLLPVKEMKKMKRKIEIGEKYELVISKVDAETGKIYLTALNERVTHEV